MPRTKGALDIKGWREHGLLRDLALNEESVEALAEKYDIQPASVYTYRWKNKHRINVVLADWSNEFSDLWAVKKHARVADLLADHDSLAERQAELIEDAERATEVMRRVDPDAAPVRVPAREWRALVRDKAKLKAQIAHEMGQDVAHAGALGGNTHLLPFMGLRAGKDTIDHAKFLSLRPDEQTVYLGMIPHFQAMFLKLTEAQRERFLEFLGEEDTYEAYGYLQDCTATEHERRQRQVMKQIHEEMAAKWLAEHPSESDDEALADAVNPVPVPAGPEPVEDEPVELVRMMPPPPAEEAPESAVEDVHAAEDHPVDEPVEMPPVADHVAEAARRLSIQIWDGVTVPRAQLAPTNDQALAHAVYMEWLAVAGALVVRGGVDPRPVTVTRIPNS